VLVAVVLVSAAWVGCLTEEQEDPSILVQHQAISDCGGFDETSFEESDGAGDAEYCAAERLNWTYDAATETLDLVDARAVLNCCGERSVELELVDGIYVVRETDAAEGAGRCDCMCVFDLALTVEGLSGGVIPVRIERHETDVAAAPQVIWEGELDLLAAAGSAVLDATEAGPWCRPE